MCVCRRLAVFAFIVFALAPGDADAAPFLLDATGTRVSGDPCGALTASATPCSLFGIDPFSAATITGTFEHDNDVALFQFMLTGTTLFSAHTTSYLTGGFDPFFGLFYGAGSGELTGRIVTVPDPTDPTGTALLSARSVDIIGADPDVFDLNDVLPDPLLQPTLLLGPGSYVLALAQSGNDFLTADFEIGGTPLRLETLAEGFQADTGDPDFNGGCTAAPGRCSFSLAVSAVPQTAAVPEPGTLSLLAIGIATAAVRHRRKKRSRL